ncbi:hypothetical protein HDV06_004108 [Boothiomyces sp. JEL0866]|nr:hypothetical protein HDV06_007089 [Boothiomyces sp. JEL0866]KAJ3321572.1 hypothetical protein HDV06_004108 [Boothiomyces sp. JEL0866]
MIGFGVYKFYHLANIVLDIRNELITNIVTNYESHRLIMLSDTDYISKHNYHMFAYRREDYGTEEAAESIMEFLFSKKYQSAVALRNSPQVREILGILMVTDAQVRIQQMSDNIVMLCEVNSHSQLEQLSDLIVSKYPEKKAVRDITRGCQWIVYDFDILLLHVTIAEKELSEYDIRRCDSPIASTKVERVLSDATLCPARPSLTVLTHFSEPITVDEVDDAPSGTTYTPRSTLTPVRKRVHFCESVVDYSAQSEGEEVRSEGTLDQSPPIKPTYSRGSSESSNETLADEDEYYEPVLPPRPKAQIWYMTKKFTAVDPALKTGEPVEYSSCTSTIKEDPDQIEITPKDSQLHIPHVNTTSLEDNPLNEMPYLLSIPFRAADATFDVATDLAASSIKILVLKPIMIATAPLRWLTRKSFCKI